MKAVLTFQLSLQILTQSFSFDPCVSWLGVPDVGLEFAVWDGLAFIVDHLRVDDSWSPQWRGFTAVVIRLWWQYGAQEAGWRLVIGGYNPLALVGTRKVLERRESRRGHGDVRIHCWRGRTSFLCAWVRLDSGTLVWLKELEVSTKRILTCIIFPENSNIN